MSLEMDILDLSSISILVVDDNKQMRALIVRILEALHVGMVQEAETANEALKRIKHAIPDIMLLDNRMDGMSGTELVHYIRHDEKSPHPYLPIVMVSGYGDHENVTTARDAGVTEYLAKPLSVAVLGQRLTAVIENSRPFVRTKDYFGPDRRRRKVPPEGSPRRRAEDDEDVPEDSENAA
ncbi:MAG: response regulator [Minwuia sp.]|nr:response regulator [Minwuia sp.]